MRLPWSKPTLAERVVSIVNIAVVAAANFVVLHEAGKRFYTTFIADKALAPAGETVEGRYRKAA